jgi:HEPN domain-containing protein
MPHDPVRVADTTAWLTRALSDLGAGAHEMTADPPFSADAVFHAQQAAEKALKGFLAWHDVPFGKTHDLAALGRACSQIEPGLTSFGRRAARLTDYAWKYRYPGEPHEPPREEAESALALAREVYDAVLARLPADVRPPARNSRNTGNGPEH